LKNNDNGLFSIDALLKNNDAFCGVMMLLKKKMIIVDSEMITF